MFNNFDANFLPDTRKVEETISAQLEIGLVDDRLGKFLAVYNGTSFNQGIYRIISVDAIAHWNTLVLSAFPSFSGRITCFAVDWLGRIFALDSARLEDGRPGVMMFEPGTAEALEIPCNLQSFHENELVQYQEEALAKSFYKQWLIKGGAQPKITQCIGYRKPLFLGGADTVDNLEVSDLDVYWTISAQLIQKIRDIPLGGTIGKVSID